MAWLARSITAAGKSSPPQIPDTSETEGSTPPSERGVKDDLSEIKDTLARQLRGVASFLAPPPQAKAAADTDDDGLDHEGDEVGKAEGIRSDIKEIGGRMKAGISKFLQIRSTHDADVDGDDDVDEEAVGVTEEVLAFVKDVAVHPRTWVSFPLPEDSDADGFELNEWQARHAAEVERRVPELADLRWELCPEHMSESRFWMVYFVLVHPKLDKYDALTLSTPDIVEARAMLTQESKSRRKVKQPSVSSDAQAVPSLAVESPVKEVPISISADESTPQTAAVNLKHIDHLPSSDNHAVVDKPGSKDTYPAGDLKPNTTLQKEEDEDGDEWLNEEASEMAAGGTIREIPINSDDDVSFSDLEEDDDTDAAKRHK